MPNKQLEWLKAGTGIEKDLRAMVIGWQCVRETLKGTVQRFNNHHFNKTPDPHHDMKIIAAKQTVMASLRELRLMLDNWHTKLKVKGVISQKTIDHRKQLLPILEQIHKFHYVRNCAFHFGDPIEDADKLVELYEYVQGFDLDHLNTMLLALLEFGESMKQDALDAPNSPKKQEQSRP